MFVRAARAEIPLGAALSRSDCTSSTSKSWALGYLRDEDKDVYRPDWLRSSVSTSMRLRSFTRVRVRFPLNLTNSNVSYAVPYH